jgi:hypothetical protein
VAEKFKSKLKKVTFVGGPKDGYSREHPEPTVPSPYYLFTINNKTIAYLLIDQDDYEALYEYASDFTDFHKMEYTDYGKTYTFTMPAYQWPWEHK